MKFNFEEEIKKAYKKYFVSIPEENLQKYTAYFYIMLTLLTVSGFGLFAIGPTLNTVSNLNKQYKDNMAVYNALSQKLANLTLLDSQYQTIQPDIGRVYSAIPKSTDIPKLTRQLENLAKLNNLQLTKLSFATAEVFPNTKVDPIYSFLFTLSVEGDKSDVNNFIASIINFDRIVGLERIITGTNQENNFTTTITGRAFFAPK